MKHQVTVFDHDSDNTGMYKVEYSYKRKKDSVVISIVDLLKLLEFSNRRKLVLKKEGGTKYLVYGSSFKRFVSQYKTIK